MNHCCNREVVLPAAQHLSSKRPLRHQVLAALLLLGLVLSSCGGGRRVMAEHPVNLGLIPFSAEAMTDQSGLLNEKLMRALDFSGAFRVVQLQSAPALLTLTQIEQAFAGTAGDSASLAAAAAGHLAPKGDSLPVSAPAGLPRWIITGAFIEEREYTHSGRLIPYLTFFPSARIAADLEYRLYDREKPGWVEIRRLTAEAQRKGGPQLADFDASDPTLAVAARDREVMREQAYQKLFAKLINDLEKLTAGKR